MWIKEIDMTHEKETGTSSISDENKLEKPIRENGDISKKLMNEAVSVDELDDWFGPGKKYGKSWSGPL